MKLKRLLAAVMAVAVVCGTFTAVNPNTAQKLGAVSASAEDYASEGVSGDFKYGIYDSGVGVKSLYITGYTGSEEVLKIPSSLDAEGTDMPVSGIAAGAFAKNTTLKSVTIAPTVKNINVGAFEDCTSLVSVTFQLAEDKAEMSVREMAFAGCTSLSSLTFDNEPKGSITYFYISEYAFLDCTALNSVTIPKYVNMNAYAPVFGYSRKNKTDDPEFSKDPDGNIVTNLVKNEDFMMNCYTKTYAAQNAFNCGLAFDYIDGPYSYDIVSSAVSDASKKNPNYNVSISDTGFKGTKVNNLDGYADCISEYYFSDTDLIAGYAALVNHKVVDTGSGEPMLEFGSVYPYTSYNTKIDDGIVSINCFGQGTMLNEYEFFADLIPDEGYIISSDKMNAVVERGVTYNLSQPRFRNIDGTDRFSHKYGTGIAMQNGYTFLCSGFEGERAGIFDKDGKKVLELPPSFDHVVSTGRSSGSALYTISSYTIGSEIEHGYNKGLMPYYSQYKHDSDSLFTAACEQEGFDDWYSEYVQDNKYCGYIDLKGNIVIPQQFADAGSFSDDGLAWVKSAEALGKYGYGSGEFTAVYPLYGYIDTTGKTVIPFDYSVVTDFDGGYAAVRKGLKYGMIDTENNTVIPFEYENSKGSKEGFMTAMKNGKWGMVDKDGNIVVPFMFEDVSLYYKGKAYAVSEGKVYRLDIKSAAEDYIYGDVNNDKKVDIEDAVKVIAHINGIKHLTDDEMIRADTTFNKKIDIEDAVLIISQVNGISKIKPLVSKG